MAEIHGLLARIVLALALLTAAWAVVLLVARRPLGTALVAGLAWLAVLVAAAGLLGLVVALTIGVPGDPLHIVYGLLAAVVLPGAWVAARGRSNPSRSTLVIGVALVVEVILVVRLFQTGG
ncbi:MAG TPA: hypothetical protein VF971_09585 [Candidatus Limnocylindrales bacterium]|jgi:hypothetical protein